MNILFLAPNYLNLERPIIHEMERQGNIVYFVEDKVFLNSIHYKVNKIKKIIRFILFRKQEEKYWKKTIKDDVNLQLKFDLFFCINGTSFDKCLYEFLKKNNPQIKTCIYLWDTIRFYNFARNLKYFDKTFTFDYQDSIDYPNLIFLPFYWINPIDKLSEIYDVSIIGSEHDDRYKIVSKIYKQLSKDKFKCYFKIYIPISQENIAVKRHYSFFRKIIKRKRCLVDYDIPEIIIRKKMPIEEVDKIIAQSRCILDTDRACQSGTTPRVIWALALGKKVITTNKNIKKLPFYNGETIQIIDRDNPVVDTDFIKNKFSQRRDLSYFEKLEIKNWVKNFTE